MISQLENLRQAVEHLKDINIDNEKIRAYQDVLEYIRTLQSSESLHYNVAYSNGYTDCLTGKEMNLDYYKTKYNNDVQSTTNQ
jgi:trans-aconitate methyltransferase